MIEPKEALDSRFIVEPNRTSNEVTGASPDLDSPIHLVRADRTYSSESQSKEERWLGFLRSYPHLLKLVGANVSEIQRLIGLPLSPLQPLQDVIREFITLIGIDSFLRSDERLQLLDALLALFPEITLPPMDIKQRMFISSKAYSAPEVGFEHIIAAVPRETRVVEDKPSTSPSITLLELIGEMPHGRHARSSSLLSRESSATDMAQQHRQRSTSTVFGTSRSRRLAAGYFSPDDGRSQDRSPSGEPTYGSSRPKVSAHGFLKHKGKFLVPGSEMKSSDTEGSQSVDGSSESRSAPSSSRWPPSLFDHPGSLGSRDEATSASGRSLSWAPSGK